MVDIGAWAGCMSSLTELLCTPGTCHTPDCMNLVPAGITQHLVQPTPHSYHSHIILQVYTTLGGLGKVAG
jgi:hypothetical protein